MEIGSSAYGRLSDEEKKKRLDTAMESEYKKLLTKNGIKFK